MQWTKTPSGNRVSDGAPKNELLARIERSIAELQDDGRPAGVKEELLAALRRERDALRVLIPVPIAPANRKHSRRISG